MLKGKKIIFKLSGSIACYKACSVISKLVQEGCEVKPVCTKSALEFVGKATLEGLTRKTVYCDMYRGEKPSATLALEHIELSKWADLAIFCPATANVINKMAAGIADDCPTSLFLSYDLSKPYLVAPAMNKNMYLHPATQEGLAKLKQWGVKIISPAEGRQACGDIGIGRLAEPEIILEAIKAELR